MTQISTGNRDFSTDSVVQASDTGSIVSPNPLEQTMPLMSALLDAYRFLGLEVSASSLLRSIPTGESESVEGLVRCIKNQGRCGYQFVPLDDLVQSPLPCFATLKERSGAEALLVESYESSDSNFSVVLYQENGERVRRRLSIAQLEDMVQGELVSLCRDLHVEHSSPKDSARRKKYFSTWLLKEVFGLAGVYRDVLLASVLINLFALASPLFVMNVYDRVVPNQATETLWVLASGLGLVLVFELLMKLQRLYFLEQAGKQIDLSLSSRLMSRVMNVRMESFPASVGNLASQLKDFDAVKQFFTSATLTGLSDVPFALLFLVTIYFIGGGIVVVPLLAASIMLIYGFCVHYPIKSVVDEMQIAAAEKNAVLVESIAGIETLKSLNAEGRQQGFWESALLKLSTLGIKAKHLSDSVSIVSSTLMQLSTMLVVVVGVYYIQDQALSLGALIACVLLSSRALSPMVQVANLMAQYQQARAALGSLDDLSDLPVENIFGKKYLSVGAAIQDVDIRDLSFSYPGGTKALHEVGLALRSGDKVAIIGKIGSGKSSLMRLMMGFGSAETGQLLINGIDVQHLDPSELRSNVGYVPQDITLFRGTLRENIVMKAPRVSQSALMEVLEVSGLLELVQQHELGLDMEIGENGKGLSGGQRQCVAIARALINNPDLLLFDELTSSMDNQSEQLIISKVREYAENKILLLTTHRASLLALVDRIIVMDHGKIIADGPKNTVLDALKRGLIKPAEQSKFGDSQKDNNMPEEV